MEQPIIKYQIKNTNQELHIFQDDNPESPNDWENDEVFLVYQHRQFQVDRKGFYPQEIHSYLTYPKEPIKEDFNDVNDYEREFSDWAEDYNLSFNDYHIFTVFAYIHSGVNLSLGEEGKIYGRQDWDTSTTGFILIKKDDNEIRTQEDNENTEKIAQGLIDTWNQYLSGEVYGFKLFEKIPYIKLKKEDLNQLTDLSQKGIDNISEIILEDKEIDSCWGFYGDDYQHIFDHLNLQKENLIKIE